MTDEQLLGIIKKYKQELKDRWVVASPHPHESSPGNDTAQLQHCAYMLDQMEVFIEEGKREKAQRWLGFVQGCLWSTHVYTIEDMKNDNRS